MRARQLGGDEARVALVCPYSEDEFLYSDIVQSMDIGGENATNSDFTAPIAVFGMKHLAQLQQHIAKWIKNQVKA